MLRCAGEAVSLYSGSFKDRRVLSFMYESFKGKTRVYRTNTMEGQATAFAPPPSHCVAPS